MTASAVEISNAKLSPERYEVARVDESLPFKLPMNSEYTIAGEITDVAAVKDKAKLSIIPVLRNVFIIPEPTPNLAGGTDDIMALVLEGQKNPRPTPDIVSIIPI